MAAPPHRSVTNIRPSLTSGQSSNSGGLGGPGSPHTPVRTIPSNFASPSTLRAEEDYIVVELGARSLRAGFAGDVLPKAVIGFGPEEQRRAGDYRKWQVGHDAGWRRGGQGRRRGELHELWQLDLRGVNLGLIGDKIDRAMREAFTKHLLVDSRPRRMALVLPSILPLPLLSTILDTIFNNFQPPTISLLSGPVLTTVAAGLRAALVVDIGWAETVVTGIYEYREVLSHRSIRASKLLGMEVLKFLGKAVLSTTEQSAGMPKDIDTKDYHKLISFEECEDIAARIAWCRKSEKKATNSEGHEALPHVKEEDEIETAVHDLNLNDKDLISIKLSSTEPPLTLRLPLLSLSQPCENAFFADGVQAVDLDDQELPLHVLVYRTLLHLPIDIRSVCMSRIVFTGGVSNMPGLKTRIIDEVGTILHKRGWDLVQGAALEKAQNNTKIRSSRSKSATDGPTIVATDEEGRDKPSGADDPEPNPYEDKLRRELHKGVHPFVQGSLRAVESLGPWSGASLLNQLKVPAVSILEREQWLQHGISGATKQGEVTSADQRQSMGPGGLRTGQVERVNWTLGPWG